MIIVSKLLTSQVSGGYVVPGAVGGDRYAHHRAQHVVGVLAGVVVVRLRPAVACRPVEVVVVFLHREK